THNPNVNAFDSLPPLSLRLRGGKGPGVRGVATLTPLLMFITLNLLTLALFLPQLSTALHQVTTWPRTGHDVDALSGLATVIRWLVYGNTANDLPWYAFLWPALFALAAFLPDWRRGAQPSWWRRLLPLAWLLITVAPFFALGLFREANLKFLLPAQIATALLIGRG